MKRSWRGNSGKQGHLFADARGYPPRIAAVLMLYDAVRVSQRRLHSILTICRDGDIKYCDMPVPEHIMASFTKRKDGQIMGLELLSIALGSHVAVTEQCACDLRINVAGVCTFGEAVRDRNLVIWSDNTGAESATRKGERVCRFYISQCIRQPSVCLNKGGARRFDHCSIVHCLWKKFLQLGLHVWVERVPTEVNIADDPSRCALCCFVRPGYGCV